MVAPLRHRQTKEAETDMFDLQPPRHISTLHIAAQKPMQRNVRSWWCKRTCERQRGSRVMPSRPGEFHPEPLTDPDLTLSRHPARATARRLPPSIEYQVPPVTG